MHNVRKRKVIDVEQWKKYYECSEDWELLEIKKTRDVLIWGKISFYNSLFMKLWNDWRLEVFYEKIWQDCQYIIPLAACVIDYDNSINMWKLQNMLWLSVPWWYVLTKRLRKKWIIGKIQKEWFVNPFIFWKWNNIRADVFHLFRETTAMLYWIKEI